MRSKISWHRRQYQGSSNLLGPEIEHSHSSLSFDRIMIMLLVDVITGHCMIRCMVSRNLRFIKITGWFH